MMQSGFNNLVGNPELEIAYLAYQQELFAQTEAHDYDAVTIAQLPAREQNQIDTMIDGLVTAGLVSAVLAERRLARIRIAYVDGYVSRELPGREVSGEFSLQTGLAAVNTFQLPESQSVAQLHEILHGQTAIDAIALNMARTAVRSYGHSLRNPRVIRDTTLFQGLEMLDETLIDKRALAASDMDPTAYLAGDYPNEGYWREINAHAAILSSNPNAQTVSRLAEYAMFTTGITGKKQAVQFTNTFPLSDVTPNPAS